MSPFNGSSATGLNLKYISSKTDEFSQWQPLAVESSFSYVTKSEKNKKPRKMAGSPHQHESCKSSITPQNEISLSQRMNGAVNSHYNTVSATEGKAKNCADKNKQDFNSDLLLTGKRLRMSPEFWTPDYALRSRSGSESECKSPESNEGYRISSGLQTYPPPNVRSSYVNEVSSRRSQTKSFYDAFNLNRHRPPAFSSRPLGQSWLGYPERQKPRARQPRSRQDDIHASGVRQHLCTRQRVPPRRYTHSPHLKRTSSQDSLRNHIPRTRSSSLPVPSKPQESRVVMEWKERRTGGVTYVTPVLKTLSDGDLSSYSKTEHAATSRTTQHDFYANDA